MRGTFNGSQSPDVFDHGRAEFYRQQEQERQEREHTERAARWIASKLGGHQYDSLAAMERSVIELVTTLQGGEPDDEMLSTIKRACVCLWLGQVDRDSLLRKCVERRETGITFVAA